MQNRRNTETNVFYQNVNFVDTIHKTDLIFKIDGYYAAICKIKNIINYFYYLLEYIYYKNVQSQCNCFVNSIFIWLACAM